MTTKSDWLYNSFSSINNNNKKFYKSEPSNLLLDKIYQ